MADCRESRYMELALVQARLAAERGEVPVGAVLVGADGAVVASDGNRPIEYNDPTAHAEMLVMRQAGQKLTNYRLSGTTLYVTIEPCVMCAGALVHARVSRVVYGADDPKAGGMMSLYHVGRDGRLNHTLEVAGGLLAGECSAVLKDFFQRKRKK
ncbi:MAG: tRNA adenosine(34) deaminase TadA [Deltaproteobacteria bacterium]|nr:tRNA adenosine(34) deaminase TadA [Deltaproteobacteria bacterium]